MAAPARSARPRGSLLRACGRRGEAGGSPLLAPGGCVEMEENQVSAVGGGPPLQGRGAQQAARTARPQPWRPRCTRPGLHPLPPSPPRRESAPARVPRAAEVAATKLGLWGPGCGAVPGCGARRGGGEGGAQEAEAGADQLGLAEPPGCPGRVPSPAPLPAPPAFPPCRRLHASRGARPAPPFGELLPRARG